MRELPKNPHVWRHYDNLGVTVCQNCAKFKKDIEKEAHYVFESGYCDPACCPRCKAEECVPQQLESIKPVGKKYISLDLDEWQ